jgi:hypothetical protein
MRHPWWTFTAGLVLLACAESTTAPASELPSDHASVRVAEESKPIRFAALRPTDRLEVRFASRGCFHEWEHLLTFTGGASGGAALATRTLSSNVMPGWRFVSPARLSAAELARLDRSVAAYRMPASERCFTTERVTLTLFRGDRAVTSEQYDDASCSAWDEADALALGALLKLERER